MKTFLFILLTIVLYSCARPVYDERYIERRLEKMRSPVVVVSKGGSTLMVKDGKGKVYIFTVNSNSSLKPKDTIK